MYQFILKKIQELFTEKSYGKKLEDYILKNNPKDICDVERLVRQYDSRISKTW